MQPKWMTIPVVLATFVGCQKAPCPPCPEPSAPARTMLRKAVASGFTRVNVKMQIIGMSLLNTKRDNDPVTLVIPNVTRHEPFLYAHDNYRMALSSGSTRILYSEKDHFSEPYKVLLLAGEELVLGTPPNESSLTYTLGGAECPATFDDLASLRWAPSLSDVLNKPVSIDAKYLKPTAPGAVAATMEITKGALSSEPADPYIWQFKDTSSAITGHRQMLTGIVNYDFTVDLPVNEPLTVKSRAFGSGSAVDLVTLMPQNGAIEFTVGVTPKDTRLPGMGTPTLVDLHFPLIYAFLDPGTLGSGALPITKPFKTGAYCLPPSQPLVNCGPDRP